MSTPVSSDKNVLRFLGQRGHLSHGKFQDLLLGRRREVREPPSPPTLLLLKGTSGQNTPMSKRHIPAWPVGSLLAPSFQLAISVSQA